MKNKFVALLSKDKTLPLSIIAAIFVSCFSFGTRTRNLPTAKFQTLPQFRLVSSGFLPNSVYPSTVNNTRINGLRLFGCWLGKSGSADATSSWMPFTSDISLLVAGYPETDGSLRVELRDVGGSISQVRSEFQNVGENWTLYTIRRSPYLHAKEFRIVARGGTGGSRGWFGFSEPFHLETNLHNWPTVTRDLLCLGLIAFLGSVLYYGPGLAFRHAFRSKVSHEELSVLIPLIGIVTMAVAGLLVWVLHKNIRASISALAIVLTVLLMLVIFFWHVPIKTQTSLRERRAFFLIAIVIIAATAKATYSLGPIDELYTNTISRTYEVGDRSDSRVPWGVVELIANGLGPASALSKMYFFPWNFSSRGPIAGMASAPIVLAFRGKVSPGIPTQTWRPFDNEGFATYRLTMIIMATSSFLVLFWVLSSVLDDNWAYYALVCACLTPFLLHEVYFTWPKLQATSFTMAAAFFLTRQRPFIAGLSTGIGYLLHPLVLMSGPAFIGIILMTSASSEHEDPPSRIDAALHAISHSLAFGFSLFLCLAFWRTVNWNNYSQLSFFTYFKLVGSHYAVNPGEWWRWRLNSLASTLVPLYTFLQRSSDPAMNSVLGRSSSVVHFFFQYWTTAVFGLSVLAYPCCVILLISFGRRHAYQFLFLIFAPLLLMVAYMGVTEVGLLRDGLHAWIFFVIYSIIFMLREGFASNSLLHRFIRPVFSARAVEVLAMFIAPAVITNGRLISPVYPFSDVFSLVGMIAAIVFLSMEQWISYPVQLKQTSMARRHSVSAVESPI